MESGDFGFKSNFVKIGEHKLHYLDVGRGETILMLHGNPTWSYLYRNLIRRLSLDYRCLAPDFLGFGLSDKPPNADYSLKKQAERLGFFVKELGLRDITLVGHDVGGIAGLNWAARNKDLVSRLVVLNTRGAVPAVWGQPDYRPPWPYLFLLPLRLPGIGEFLVQGLNFLIKVVMPLSLLGNRRFLSESRRGFEFPYRQLVDRKAQLDTVRQIPIFKSDPIYHLLLETGLALAGWQVPAQIIWGLKDPAFKSSITGEFERLLPNHRPTLLLPHAGHFLTEDQPDVITEKIIEFMQLSSINPYGTFKLDSVRATSIEQGNQANY